MPDTSRRSEEQGAGLAPRTCPALILPPVHVQPLSPPPSLPPACMTSMHVAFLGIPGPLKTIPVHGEDRASLWSLLALTPR